MVRNDLVISKDNGGQFCGIYTADGTMIGQAYRGGGLGSAVFDAAEQHIIADANVTDILSGVMVNNPAALRFWERHGYIVTGGPVLQADGTTTWDTDGMNERSRALASSLGFVEGRMFSQLSTPDYKPLSLSEGLWKQHPGEGGMTTWIQS